MLHVKLLFPNVCFLFVCCRASCEYKRHRSRLYPNELLLRCFCALTIEHFDTCKLFLLKDRLVSCSHKTKFIDAHKTVTHSVSHSHVHPQSKWTTKASVIMAYKQQIVPLCEAVTSAHTPMKPHSKRYFSQSTHSNANYCQPL